MANDHFLEAIPVEATTPPSNEQVKSISSKKRNRLSAGDKKAKLEAVASDYRKGYPMLAIMLRQHLTKPQLNDMLAHLFVIERLTPVTPTYEVVAVSSPIKALFQSANSPVEYIRVEQSHRGINLTPYIAGDENGHN